MSPQRTRRAHEPEGANTRAMTAAAVGLLVALAVIAVLMRWLGGAFLGGAEPVPASVPAPASDQADHWVDPPADLAALRTREDAILESYGWSDRAAGAARIPLRRALELAAQGVSPAADAPGATAPDSPPTGGAP